MVKPTYSCHFRKCR